MVGAGRGDDDARDRYHSMPRWPFWPASIGCLTFVISVTRSAAAIRSGCASRPVMMTCWWPGRAVSVAFLEAGAKVVVTYVPFVDVINTMLDETLPLTVGEFEEWGNPKKPDEYRYMKQYSPYDNVTARAYPTMLVRSSYNDSQVMYWEPAKYVAKLRSVKKDRNPLLFKCNMDAGHGGASGRYDALRERAFVYAFLLTQLGVE